MKYNPLTKFEQKLASVEHRLCWICDTEQGLEEFKGRNKTCAECLEKKMRGMKNKDIKLPPT